MEKFVCYFVEVRFLQHGLKTIDIVAKISHSVSSYGFVCLFLFH